MAKFNKKSLNRAKIRRIFEKTSSNDNTFFERNENFNEAIDMYMAFCDKEGHPLTSWTSKTEAVKVSNNHRIATLHPVRIMVKSF